MAREQETIFLDAAEAGDLGLLARLLGENPSLLHARRETGRTPLHEAAYNGTAEVVGLLLSFGAEVEAADNDGRTPLRYAVEDGFDDIAAVGTRAPLKS